MANDLLKGKHAVIYGATGRIGQHVARTFAQEGASVHLVARSVEPLAALASEIGAEFAAFDAGEAGQVDAHLDSLPHVDFSFNLNPPRYPVITEQTAPGVYVNNILPYVGQAARFNYFFSIGQSF